MKLLIRTLIIISSDSLERTLRNSYEKSDKSRMNYFKKENSKPL